MFAVSTITLFCLVSMTQSAPLACENVVRPLAQLDPHRLAGRWPLVAGSVSDLSHLEKFKSKDSASINFANASETSITSFTRIFSSDDSCEHMQFNITLGGSGFSFDQLNFTVTFLSTTCPDCIVMRFDDESKKPLRVYLFSRRREVEQKELEEFSAQAECLNMLPPAVKDPNKELCPEKVSRGKEETE